MKLYEYLLLSKEQQVVLLWDKGIFIDNIKAIDCSYSLYAIDKFFVEIRLSAIDDSIEELYPFLHGFRLDKYANLPKNL